MAAAMVIRCWPILGTTERVAMGMGAKDISELRTIGQTLAYLKEPEPPKGIKDAFAKLPLLKDLWSMAPHVVKKAPCQEIVMEGADVDLSVLPIQHCWPEDVAPLVTWGFDGDARAAQKAPESGHLPAAGDWQKQADYALAGAPRRRAGFSGT